MEAPKQLLAQSQFLTQSHFFHQSHFQSESFIYAQFLRHFLVGLTFGPFASMLPS